LNPDALVIAGDTIENLKSKERMVGIVTHVQELADRVPVRFVVTKGSGPRPLKSCYVTRCGRRSGLKFTVGLVGPGIRAPWA